VDVAQSFASFAMSHGRIVCASQWMRIDYCKGQKKWLTEMPLVFFPKLRERYALIVCAIKFGRTMNANILDASNGSSTVEEEVLHARCAPLAIGNISLDVAAARSKFARIVAATGFSCLVRVDLIHLEASLLRLREQNRY
jgi:hypothetical protein